MSKSKQTQTLTQRVLKKMLGVLRATEFAPVCPHGLGATVTADGTHFAVYSPQAHSVEVCLYDVSNSAVEIKRVSLACDETDVWHAFVPKVAAGALYGYRADGPWQPENGLWFNAHKLLLDPYAKSIFGEPSWNALMTNIDADGKPDAQDSGPTALKSVVICDDFDWGDDAAPGMLWRDTVIYETHVRGFSKQNQTVPSELRGTYAGLAHAASMDYLKALGITAVQLLPVHQHLDDGFLLARKLTNYWGYNTLGFFSPQGEYAAARDPQAQINEFKTMVRELHRAGIEVILDVVYNHTAEGSEDGPLLFLRGLDNGGYYMLNGDRRTVNYTGCGNTVNAACAPALRLILDSLRYWVQQMHVDGFRFDLAATLGRNGEAFNYNAAFFLAIAADPVLSRVKMIAEPWDIGPNGYQPGGFPKPWRETNGPYRDAVRRFWHGDDDAIADFSKRLCGSEDYFGFTARGPLASVNMLTCHDGFTLRDLWSYNEKHNEANGENNNDGDGNNHSWNCGEEGETADATVLATRRKLARASLATVFCSLGVPFLVMGDERWRTQNGNNNCYCQDNEISWLDWMSNDNSEVMLGFTQRLIRFRKEHPALRRSKHFTGEVNPKTKRPDVAWLDADGKTLAREEWHDAKRHFFAAVMDVAEASPTVVGSSENAPLLFLYNASPEDIAFSLPAGHWKMIFDTACDNSFPEEAPVHTEGEVVTSSSRSVACFVLND